MAGGIQKNIADDEGVFVNLIPAFYIGKWLWVYLKKKIKLKITKHVFGII